MLIKPENGHLYPEDWQEIRARILEGAGHKCEWPGCHVPNGALIIRLKRDPEIYRRAPRGPRKVKGYRKPVKVMLTITHLNHDPTDNRPENLLAMCQLHHNRYDVEHRKQTRRKRQQQLDTGTLACAGVRCVQGEGDVV